MKSFRMPSIMDGIGSILRQDHFEIQNTKEKTIGFQRKRTGFIQRVKNSTGTKLLNSKVGNWTMMQKGFQNTKGKRFPV